MPTTIEQLELEVQSSSTSAVAGIDALSASLSKLKNAVRGGVGLTSVANQVRNLDTALKSMDSSGADKIDKLASSLEKLKGLGSLKISSSIGNQLQNIGSAAASLTGVDFSAMEKLGTALQPLNNLNASGLKSTINALNKLPKLADTLDNMDMTKFNSQIQQLSTALAPLTNQLNAVTAAFNRLPTNIQRAITVTNRISQENNKAANSYMNLYAKIKMANGKSLLLWLGDKNKTLAYAPKSDEMVLTVHRWFANKSCPGDWLYNRLGNLAAEVTKRLTGGSTDTGKVDVPSDGKTLYRVQTGAFSKRSNADAWAAKLKAAGFDTYIVQMGNLYKVQVGAYSQKSNAENMVAKLKAAGYDAFITTKSGTAAGTAKKSADEIAKEIYNGTCSDARWSSWGNGTDRVNRLKQAGYDPSEVQSEVNKLF